MVHAAQAATGVMFLVAGHAVVRLGDVGMERRRLPLQEGGFVGMAGNAGRILHPLTGVWHAAQSSCRNACALDSGPGEAMLCHVATCSVCGTAFHSASAATDASTASSATMIVPFRLI
ncbi:MAG: hypothetical protein NVV67_16360 [Pseudoxanthomonas sp.]|nr:hypothetical protein [Pseudoxanthomonas sp.]